MFCIAHTDVDRDPVEPFRELAPILLTRYGCIRNIVARFNRIGRGYHKDTTHFALVSSENSFITRKDEVCLRTERSGG